MLGNAAWGSSQRCSVGLSSGLCTGFTLTMASRVFMELTCTGALSYWNMQTRHSQAFCFMAAAWEDWWSGVHLPLVIQWIVGAAGLHVGHHIINTITPPQSLFLCSILSLGFGRCDTIHPGCILAVHMMCPGLALHPPTWWLGTEEVQINLILLVS